MAELGIAQQAQSSAICRNKGALMITFCVSVLGYVYASDDFAKWGKCLHPLVWTIGNWSLAGVFVYSIRCGIKALNIKIWLPSGAAPEYSLLEYFGGDFNKRARELLRHYNVSIADNQRVLNERIVYLEKARKWGIAGISAAFIMLLLAKSNVCAIFPMTDICRCTLSALQ